MKKGILLFSLFSITTSLAAQRNNPPGLNLIRSEDLKNDLYTFAGAPFKGRSAGTIDELKASVWLAEQFRAIGLIPAGDDRTYFQFFTLLRKQIANNSTIEINAAQAPPMPLNRLTISGIAVILIFFAASVPMMAPIIIPPKIQP